MKEVCSKFKIQHHNSIPYRPKMNGAIEAANKNIKKIIEKTTDTYKDWHEKLPFALHAYHTSVRTSTGATPFLLVYGWSCLANRSGDTILKSIDGNQLEETKWVWTRYKELNLIEEMWLSVLCHGQLYQKWMMRAHNKKIQQRQFKEGDLVLKSIPPNQQDPRRKWAPNWQGPYVVKNAFFGGALILTEMDGDELQVQSILMWWRNTMLKWH